MSRSPSHLSRKIWIAVSTPFQVNFFSPLIKRLKKEFDFIITARDHDRIFSMLDKKGLKYFPLSNHGGEKLEGKLQAYARNVEQLVPIIKKEKPDLLLTERWPEAVRVAFGFDIPAWTIYYDEREGHVNRMVFPLSSKVFVPKMYTSAEMRQNGIDTEKIVWFNGFHTCYLKGEAISQRNFFQELGCKSPIVLVRPEPEFATFFGKKREILERTVSLLVNNGVKDDFNVIVFPRSSGQASCYEKYPVTVMSDAIPENPVFHADVVVGAAETMLMEAFVLGKPAVSAMYWEESKPVVELHKYIPHMTDPKEVASKTLEYLNPEEQLKFHRRAKLVVDLMENPITKMEKEIRNFYGERETNKIACPKRRSQLDIYVTIMRTAAFRPLKLTHIMQSANLSHSKVKKDLKWLKKRHLVDERSDITGEQRFKTTAEGLKIISDYNKILEKLS